MPTPLVHAEGAKANLRFADALAASAGDVVAVRWAITALFYAGVHAVRGYLLDQHNEVVTSHEHFRTLETKYRVLLSTNREYQNLKQQSESARYYLNSHFTWKDYQSLRRDADRLLTRWLTKINGASYP